MQNSIIEIGKYSSWIFFPVVIMPLLKKMMAVTCIAKEYTTENIHRCIYFNWKYFSTKYTKEGLF